MAAGLGSRFGGGIKQLAKLGPSGEIIMDYSIHDALEAGFDEIVFIIRKDIEKDFREIIGDRVEKIAKCKYAFQEIDKLPEGYRVPEGRKKPWGTAHALIQVRDLIDCPFAVINADDFYGREGFKLIHDSEEKSQVQTSRWQTRHCVFSWQPSKPMTKCQATFRLREWKKTFATSVLRA